MYTYIMCILLPSLRVKLSKIQESEILVLIILHMSGFHLGKMLGGGSRYERAQRAPRVWGHAPPGNF